MAFESLGDVQSNYAVRNLSGGVQLLLSDGPSRVYLGIIMIILVIAAVGPMISPYEYNERLYNDEGEFKYLEEPSVQHPLGTTDDGYDVLSRLMYGARVTMISGFMGGALIITIGMSVGVTAGYVGGLIDEILMRITDFVYGVPLIPFAIVLLTFFGIGFFTSITVIGLLLWRGNARVLRAQVLQIKQRPFIQATKATGASTPRIIIRHILPNVAPMAILFFSLGIGYSILTLAGLSFLGISNPFIPSWGVMLRNAYQSGQMATAWWWSLPPGFLISITVLSAIMLGRRYESLSGQADDDAFVEGM